MTKKIKFGEKEVELNSREDLEQSLCRVLDKFEGRKITQWIIYVESEVEGQEDSVMCGVSLDTPDGIELLENIASCMEQMSKKSSASDLH